MNFKIAICDDAPAEIQYLSKLVRQWAEGAQHTASITTFPSAEAFLFRYSEEKDFDILLLDVQMQEMNGVELAKVVRGDNERVQIVFITGLPDFVSDGYEVSALHYLLKPVSLERLFGVLDRAAERIGKREKVLQIPGDRGIDLVPVSKILYVEAQKQWVLLHTDQRSYRIKQSLSETEGQMDEFFFRCQRSFLVNLRYVAHIRKDCVVLKNGREVPISRGMAERVSKEIIRLF